ncbi:pentapeptide repeat-containing protein [Variovorax sp. LT1R20]|uniref:pentapeptide repeat-containing protein n=1 Tax=Variovorax sp. LT1R20 TaxID=3443729 RepID=UPI003F49AB51
MQSVTVVALQWWPEHVSPFLVRGRVRTMRPLHHFSRPFMRSLQIIQDHDKWRKGVGGAPAGLAGESDGNAYAGLDLNLATFASSTFSGSSFTSTSFMDAVWTSCQFNGCTFSLCDLQRIRITGCTFVDCTFNASQLKASQLSDCTFTRCHWIALNFDASHWSQVKLLACSGRQVSASDLQGEQVDFTGSQFEDMQLANARIN